MRQLLIFGALSLSALLSSLAWGQGVTAVEPTVTDLMKLLGDVVVIELELPAGTKTIRIAQGVTAGEGLQEVKARLEQTPGEPEVRLVRLLMLAPSGITSDECDGYAFDLITEFGAAWSSRTRPCVRLPDVGARSSFHVVLTGGVPKFEVWTPIFARFWSPLEQPAAHVVPSVDLTQSYVIQVLVSAQEFENASDKAPLDAEGLLDDPRMRDWGQGRGLHIP